MRTPPPQLLEKNDYCASQSYDESVAKLLLQILFQAANYRSLLCPHDCGSFSHFFDIYTRRIDYRFQLLCIYIMQSQDNKGPTKLAVC